MVIEEIELQIAYWLEWKDLRYNWHNDLCLSREEAIRKAEEIIQYTNPRPEEMPSIKIESRKIIKFKKQ
jgi:hypothetical protein